MSTGKIQVYYGAGRGKTSAALGYAIHEASKGESVIVIQFLKRKDEDEISFLGRLEPEIRLFRFQKSEKYYNELPDEGQLEEQMNMKNGINYARKVLQTGECNILILDEVLGLLNEQIVSEEEIVQLMELKSDDMDLIMTGQIISDGIITHADEVYEICINASKRKDRRNPSVNYNKYVKSLYKNTNRRLTILFQSVILSTNKTLTDRGCVD